MTGINSVEENKLFNGAKEIRRELDPPFSSAVAQELIKFTSNLQYLIAYICFFTTENNN